MGCDACDFAQAIECGISWAERSPSCPKMITNRHPVH